MPRISTSLCALFVVGLVAPAAAAAAGTGGTAVAQGPKVTGARCADGVQWRCSAGRRLTLVGDQLTEARSVVFMGGPGKADDRRARPRARAAHALSVAVPREAVSGRLAVQARSGYSNTSRVLRISGSSTPDGAGPTTTLFAGSRRRATFRYRVEGPVPTGAAIEIVRADDGRVVCGAGSPPAPRKASCAGTASLAIAQPRPAGTSSAFPPGRRARSGLSPIRAPKSRSTTISFRYVAATTSGRPPRTTLAGHGTTRAKTCSLPVARRLRP